MRESILLKNISVLEEKDRKQFQKWLESPLFNKRADLIALFQLIHKSIDKNPKTLIKRTAWDLIYPNEVYQEAKMNLIMSLLLQQLRAFLAWQAWQADEAAQQVYLCRALRSLGLDAEFERAWEHADTVINELPYRDEQYYWWNNQLYKEKFDHQSLKNRINTMDISLLAENRNIAHQLGQLRMSCSMEILKNIAQPQPEPGEKNEKTATEIPGIRLYTRLLQALKNPEEEAAFLEAQDLLNQFSGQFREAERKELYLISLNFCIRKINSGHAAFRDLAFQLYKNGLENKALFDNGILSQFTYKNATSAGIMVGQFDWVRDFLEQYKKYLHPRERHSTYTYNLAVYHFRLQNYDQAMELLRDANLGDDSLTNLDARSMLARIYYERGFWDALDALLDSFTAYLRRHNDVGYQKANYENLIRFLRKLMRNAPLNKDLQEKLAQEIAQTPQLAERNWLLTQLNLLRSN